MENTEIVDVTDMKVKLTVDLHEVFTF